MASRDAFVNLIVRASTQGDKAIAGLADILANLFDEARAGSSDIGELGKTIGALDKAAGAIAGSMDKAGAAVSKQRADITENNAAYTALLRQQAEAKKALENGSNFVGPRTPDQTAQYKAVAAEVDRLDAAVSKLFTKVTQQNEALAGSQSSLLNLSATSRTVAEATATATAQIELQTRALQEREEAAKKQTPLQQRINAATGVDRPAATGSAADAAPLLLQAGEQYAREEAAAMRDAALAHQQFEARVKAGVAALGEEARAAERLQAASDTRNSTAAYNAFEARAAAGAKAMRDEAQATEDLERDAKRLRNTLDPLAAVQARFNAELERARALQAAGKISAEELATAETHLAAEAEKAKIALANGGKGPNGAIGLFGLRPYELQNLSYQVNDVVSGFAQGQRASQILAQQGGQILQLFPKVTGAIFGAFKNPYILGFVATIGVLALSLKRAADDAERLRINTATLGGRADGSNYNAQALSDQEKSFQRLGASSEDAHSAITTFLDHSIAPDKLSEFSKAAQATADVLGIKLPDAAQQVAEAFTGGYDAIAKFDDKLNFLTATERTHIRTMFEEGEGNRARTEALNIYAAKQQEVADKSRGDWASAARDLGTAWSDFLGFLSKTTVVETFSAALKGLAAGAREAGEGLRSLSETDAAIDAINRQVATIANLKKQLAADPTNLGTAAELSNQKRNLDDMIQRYNELAKAQGKAALKSDGTSTAVAVAPGANTTSGGANSVDAKRVADEKHQIDIEDQLQRLRDAGQVRILSAAERARREELAGLVAAKSASDATIAAADKRRAVAHETADIDKESIARNAKADSDREKAIKAYLNAIVAAEGTGKNKAGSSAIGAGQFTRSTFIGEYKKINPDTSFSDDTIANLRQNSTIALKVLEVFTRDNAKFIQDAGKEVNAANLYLIHFLGRGTGGAALRANPNTPIDQIIDRNDPNAAAVKSQNAGYLRTDKGKGAYRTVSQLQTFLGSKVKDDPGSNAQTDVLRAEVDLIAEAKQKQDAFDESVRHTNEDHRDTIKALTEQQGLYGTALLAAQRAAAVTAAEREERQKVEDANKNLKPGEAPVVVSKDQITSAREIAAALFDAQHASDALNASLAEKQRPVDDLGAQKDQLKSQAEFLRSIGDNDAADKVDKQIRALTPDIQKAYDALIEFYQALSPTQRVQLGIVDDKQLQNIIDKLKQAKTASQEWGKVLGVDGQQIAQAFASSAASAFTNFINKVAAGKNVFKALGSSVKELAATFISSIAQMILKLLAYAAAVAILRAFGVPIPGGSAPSLHTGGVVGGSAGGQRRTTAPGLFLGAMRYHTGGVAGLAPDEVPAILRRGEEVLTASDPRHRANGGASGGSGSTSGGNTTIINVNDPAEALRQALQTPAGEKVLINHVSNNANSFNAALSK